MIGHPYFQANSTLDKVEVLEVYYSTCRSLELPAMTALDILASAVAEATPANAEQEAYLHEAAAVLAGEQTLSVGDVAKRLGVSSSTTIHNWLEKGFFPGALRTVGGHRRFLLADVVAVEERMRLIDAENEAGELEIPDYGDEDPYAGRRGK